MGEILNDTPVIVNKSGCPEIELLANSIQTTSLGREYIVNELIESGFKTIRNVTAISVSEMMCMCPFGIRDIIPNLYAYAMNLIQLGF